MCLDTLSKTKPKANGVGYKVFQLLPSGEIAGLIYSNPTPEFNKYLQAEERWHPRTFNHGQPYRVGFHVFKSLRACKKWWGADGGGETLVVKKVRYRGAHTQGIQDGSVVIVAAEMRILKRSL